MFILGSVPRVRSQARDPGLWCVTPLASGVVRYRRPTGHAIAPRWGLESFFVSLTQACGLG